MRRPHPDLSQFVYDCMDEWHTRGHADARAVIAAHPELRNDKSLFMELALTEYELRKEAGEDISPDDFCDQFPEYRESLVELLDVDENFDRRPQLSPHDKAELWPQPGASFLGYKIVESLGRGGLARVFLAQEPHVGERFVVLKISSFSAHEAHALGKLQHPSIVPIYSAHDDTLSGLSAICMPFLGLATGIDLIDAAFVRAKRNPDGGIIARVARDTRPLAPMLLPANIHENRPRFGRYPDAVAQLGLELAEALVAAHASGIVHCDIKPSNILLAYSGRAMLLDFNLSTGGQRHTLQVGGTLAYMAPEFLRSLMPGCQKTARPSDPASDIYSLGAVLYQLLTGQLPHGAGKEAPQPNDYQGWLACKNQTPPAKVGSMADTRLSDIVLKCLEFDPAARYSSAAKLAADLQAYLGRRAQLLRFTARHRRKLLAAGAALAMGFGGLAAFIGSRPSELDVLYQQGLRHYDAGQFAEAADRFSQCLELKPGWHSALFGRAQSLRALGKFREARNDYLGLKDLSPAWAYAFAGYCNLRVNDYGLAWSDLSTADKAGLRDVASLLNFALANKRRNRYADAAAICSSVLAIDPMNTHALRERARMLLALTINDRARLLDAQALRDAKDLCRLDSTYDSACFCAYIHAEAALKDAAIESDAIRYLQVAMERGLPQSRLRKLPPSLKRLLTFVDAALLYNAPNSADIAATHNFFELPTSADWRRFAADPGRKLIASRQ